MNDTTFPQAPAGPASQSVQSPLYDLLARSWSLDAPIGDVAIDKAGKVAGFALQDGRVALMAIDDPESALSRMRVEADSGRSTIRPREKAPAVPVLTPRLTDGTPLLAASGTIGLIVAGQDGRIHRVTPRGQAILLTDKAGPIRAMASNQAGQVAIVRDGQAYLHDEAGMVCITSLPASGLINSLAFTPDGRGLALMLSETLLVGSPDEGFASHPVGGSGPLVFSADGKWLAGSNGVNGIWLLQRSNGRIARISNFRAPPSVVAFSRPAGAVFASGAFRAAGWSLAMPPWENESIGALKTGRSGLVLIERIAPHPARDLIALGTADGAVSIARIGYPEEMPLRQADGSAVTALAWSNDGLHLAIGTAGGQAALVTLPPQLFK